MPAIQVHSVLDCVRDIHRGLSRQYRELSESAANEKLKLLYEDMASREKKFSAVVDDFEREAEKDVLTTWLQFIPEEVVKFARNALDVGEPGSLEEAIEELQAVNRLLGDAYRDVAEETECGHLCELFRNLAELEANNDLHLSKVMLEE